MEIDTFYILAILRAFFYFWLAVEFIGISSLYYFGYYRIKKTRIIGTMSLLFLVIGIFFCFLIIVSITGVTDTGRYQYLVNYGCIIYLPLLYFIRRFKDDSLKVEDGKHIEKGEKKIPLDK